MRKISIILPFCIFFCSFTEGPISRTQGGLYRFADPVVRNTYINALTGRFSKIEFLLHRTCINFWN